MANNLLTSIQDPNAISSPQDNNYSSVDISVEEKSELALALSVIDKAKKARKDVDKDWDKCEAYYNGDQYYGKKRPTYKAAPVANKIRPGIQTILPIMTDARPGFDVIPQEPSDYSFASSISEVTRNWWNRHSVELVVSDWILNALKFSGGIVKVVWDKDLENGKGDVHVVNIDPRNFYPADGAIDVNNNCPYTVEYYPARVGELKRRFPESADKIRATGPRNRKDDNGNGLNTDILLVSPIDKADGPFPEGVTNINGAGDNDVVWAAEIWIDDESVEEVSMDDGTTAQKRKFPNGKIIQCIPDLNVLLKVDHNPYRDGQKPYVRLINTSVPGRFWGEGEVLPYVHVQDLINRTLATIYDYCNAITNPVWIMDFESGVDPTMITNQIGLVIMKARGSEVRREAPPNLPPQVFEFYGMMSQEYDSESGIHDITQGRKPVGVTAAEAISTMQEAAQTRIRHKERNLGSALNQLGQMIVSRVMQYYRKPRVVRITGKSDYPEYFEFYIDEDNDGNLSFNKMEYQFDDVDKKYVPNRKGFQNMGQTKGQFDIQVISGTSLPAAKAQRGNLALKLAEMQQIDQKALLEFLEIPNADEIMNRMQEKAKEQAEAAAAAPPPPQGR